MPSTDDDDTGEAPSSQLSSQPGSQSRQSRQPPAATVSRQSPETSSAGTSTCKKRNKNTMTHAGTAADEAIVAISKTMEGTEWIEKVVEALLTQSKSPKSVWATWMGTELEAMHPYVWDQCPAAGCSV